MTERRCCAKCKTPYNCGNHACPCHKGSKEDQDAWLDHFRNTDHEAQAHRYDIDRNPRFY